MQPPDDPDSYSIPPEYWVIGPLVEYHACSECNALLIRYWDKGSYYCVYCGLEF